MLIDCTKSDGSTNMGDAPDTTRKIKKYLRAEENDEKCVCTRAYDGLGQSAPAPPPKKNYKS